MQLEKLRQRLEPLLSGELARWDGLPRVSVAELVALGGKPLARDSVKLGAYSAERLRFFSQEAQRALLAYARDEAVVMVELVPPPDIAVMTELGEPDAVLPQEMFLEDAYAHEYLYCARGLLLTVAQPFGAAAPNRLHRCRGIASLNDPGALGPELYTPLDTDVKW